MAFDTFDTDAGIVANGVVFSNGNLTATGSAPFTSIFSSGIAQAIEGKKSGKWYVEFTLNVASGNTDGCGVVSSWGSRGFIGNFDSAGPSGDVGWGYYTNQNVAHLGVAVTAVNNTTYGAGAVIGIAIDLDNGRAWWRLNTGSWIGTAGTPNPATNTNGFDISFLLTNNCRVYPAVNLSGATAKWTANFGASAFTGTVPSGFTAGWTNTTAGTYFGTFATSGRSSAVSTPAINDKAGSPYIATFSGLVASFTIPFTTSVVDLKGLIYDATGVGGLPGAQLGISTNTIMSGTYGEQTFIFSGVNVVLGATYWFGVVSDSGSNATIGIPFTSGIASNAGTYASPTNPFGASPTVTNNRIPIMVFAGAAPPASPPPFSRATRLAYLRM